MKTLQEMLDPSVFAGGFWVAVLHKRDGVPRSRSETKYWGPFTRNGAEETLKILAARLDVSEARTYFVDAGSPGGDP